MKTIDFEEVQKCVLFLASEIQHLRVENSELRAQIDALRGQYEDHTHDVFENRMFGGECVMLETWGPK